jgi:two-component system KDP operon response regulator KdpE
VDAPDFTDAHDPHRREGSANPGAPHTTVSDALGAQILLIEDDPALRTGIAAALERAGHRITAVGDGVSGMEELRSERHEIVLLDLGLPLISGWEILESLPQPTRRSVIVISASGDDQAKVWALDLGADDYLTKPFTSDKLITTVGAVLLRVRFHGPRRQTVSCLHVVLDMNTRMVFRDGVEVLLSPTEYVLLTELAANAGHAIEATALLSRLSAPTHVGDRGYLRVFIKRPRGKLEDDPANPALIVTVDRHGYRFGPTLRS